MQSPKGIPVRPVYPPDETAKALPRACYAAMVATRGSRYPPDICRQLFPRDEVAPQFLEQRAAITGATTTTAGWADTLVSRAVTSWLGTLLPSSAAAALISRGVSLPLQGWGSIGIPLRVSAPAPAPWVSEDAGIPLRYRPLTTTELGPGRKMAILVVVSRELLAFTNAEPIFTALLSEEAALSLDSAYFSTAAGSSSAHAGLLNGLTAGTGSASMADDLSALAGAVMSGGSGAEVLFIAAPGRAAAARVRLAAAGSGTIPILPSLALPADRVIAVDPGALVHGFGPDPAIVASEEATLHMSDTPVDIGTTGAPAVVAAPTQNMFQTSQVATRLLLDIAFAKRRAGAVAYLDGCTW